VAGSYSPSEVIDHAVDPAQRDFSSFDEDSYLRVLAAIEPLDFRGLALAAPEHFSLDNGRMPLLAIAIRTRLRDWEFPVEETLIAVVHLDTGRSYVAFPFASPEHKIVDPPSPRREPRPLGLDAQAVYTRIEPIDIRPLSSVPWAPGSWACTLCSGERRSNTVTFELRGDPTASPGGTIEPSVDSSTDVQWIRNADSPDLSGTGIAIRYASAPDGHGGTLLFGSLRVPMGAAHSAAQPDSRAATTSTPAAYVPVMFVRLGTARIQPAVSRLFVPVVVEANRTPGTEILAHFCLDPFVGEGVPAKGDYWVHSVVDRYVAEPQLLHVP